MSNIDFSLDRYERVKKVYADWWAHKSEKPVVGAIISDRAKRGKIPKCGVPTQATVNLTTPIEDWLDAIEYEYSGFSFYGDAYPWFNMDCFGPGLVSAFLGANLDNSSGRVWFHKTDGKSIEELEFRVDKENVWLKRVLEFCRKATERFQGQIIFSMPDLGGVLDILSTFLPGSELLLELYDHPEEVKKLTKQILNCWFVYYDMIAEALNSKEFGYTDWSCIYSKGRTYVTQCDFSYMIGNDMFKEFAFDDLKVQAEKLDTCIYHLDGEGELNHLDDLLSIKKIDAIQWVPGSNGKLPTQYPELYNKILDHGKQVQVLNHTFDGLFEIIKQTGRSERLLFQARQYDESFKSDALKTLKSLNIEL